MDCVLSDSRSEVLGDVLDIANPLAPTKLNPPAFTPKPQYATAYLPQPAEASLSKNNKDTTIAALTSAYTADEFLDTRGCYRIGTRIPG